MWPVRRRLTLHALVPGDRHEALSRTRDAISDSGGWVTEVHLYSDLAACLALEVPATAGPALAARLLDAEIRLDAASKVELESLPTHAPEDVPATLELSFATGRGELRHELPAVPG